jgi:hypothetical protein
LIVPGVVFGVIVALLRGGKLERLEHLGLKAIPLVWVALAMRLSVGFLERRDFAHANWVQVAAYIIFFVVVGVNITLPGMKFFGLGSLMNFAVIAANGGAMPVSAQAMAIANITDTPTGTHVLMTSETRLWYLADIIPAWTPFPQIISVGDIFIIIGIFLFIQHRMLHGEIVGGLVSVDK